VAGRRAPAPITAAQLLVSWSYAGRLRSEAAFAALAGANPIPASSGQVTRHRLNRGGDRQLNRALHTVALVRRCVKRAIARQLFKLLERYDRSTVELRIG
jgi:transposase